MCTMLKGRPILQNVKFVFTPLNFVHVNSDIKNEQLYQFSCLHGWDHFYIGNKEKNYAVY